MVKWLDLANKNIECPVKCEFQVYNKYVLRISLSLAIVWATCTKKSFIVYLKFKFNQASCILSVNPCLWK